VLAARMATSAPDEGWMDLVRRDEAALTDL
jgi:hypothetical protein